MYHGSERQGWNVLEWLCWARGSGVLQRGRNDFAGEARICDGARGYLWRRLKPTLLERTSGCREPSIGGVAGGYVGTGRNACATGG